MRVAFLRALRRTDWVGAARLAAEAAAVERRASHSSEGAAAGLAAKGEAERGVYLALLQAKFKN